MSSDDNDKSTEQVLEYYKKISQNRNLSKYFSGTSVSYLPPVDAESTDDQNEKKPTESLYHINQPININIDEPLDEPKEGSPNASSLESPSAEHRKLEWDNGADIGYSSARNNNFELKLRKSLSLPLLDNLKDIKPIIYIPTKSPTTTIKVCTSNENIDALIFSSSSSSNQSKKNSEKISSSSTTDNTQNPQSSSTSSSNPPLKTESTTSNSNETKFEDFQTTLNFLKNKIGLPEAQSTPYIVNSENATENLRPSTSSKPIGKEKSGDSGSKTVSKEVSKTKMQDDDKSFSPSKKQIKKRQKIETRIVELSISTPINVNCSGLDLSSNKPVEPKGIQTEPISQHSIETQFDYKNKPSQKPQTSTSRPNIVSISEDSASSFEYFKVNNDIIQTQRTAVKEPKNKEKTVESTSKNISLSECSNASRTEDIDRLIEAFHKLLKTKKMNSTTKKKYMKKVFKEFCQIESSSSSTSSDLFFPKKDKSNSSKVDFKESKPLVTLKTSSNDFLAKQTHHTSSESRSLTESECQKCIEELDNITKVTHKNDNELDKSKSSKKLTSKDETTSGNIFSTASSGGNITRMTSAHLCTDAVLDLHEKLSPETGIIKTVRQDQVVPDEIKTSKICSNESKSDSKETIDTKVSTSRPQSGSKLSTKYADNYVLKFAENERNYQLSWINNEINHLSKLKSILEKSSKPANTQTNVYNITETHGSSERNYVIETNGNIPANQNINYVINGKEYIVTNSQKSSTGSEQAIKADIEFHFNEHETNIKISTICNTCKQVICSCPSKATLHSKLSSLKSESNLCLNCHQYICCCQKKKESIEDKHDTPSPESTQSRKMCLCCQLVGCICQKGEVEDKNYASSGISPKTTDMVPEEIIVGLEDGVSKSSSSLEGSNSLQKVFKKCCCTIDNTSCSCNFVKKLIGKFRTFQEKSSDLPKEDKPSTSEGLVSISNEKQDRSGSSKAEDLSDNFLAVKNLRNILYKSTQTESEVVTEATQTDNFLPNINKETYLRNTQIKQKFDDDDLIEENTMANGKLPKKSNALRHVGIQVFPNFETAKPKTLASKFHKEIQEPNKKDQNLYKNLVNELPKNAQVGPDKKVEESVEDKTDKYESKETCSKCQKCKYGSKSDKTSGTMPQSENTSKSSTTSLSDSNSIPSSRITCNFCKQKAFLVEVNYLQNGDDTVPICSRCYYNRPLHCGHKANHMSQCLNNYWHKEKNVDIYFCKCCRIDITKCPRRPKGIVYTVTLRDDDFFKRRRKSSKSLDNIQIEKGWCPKSLKNQENYDEKKNSLEKERRKETVYDKDKTKKAKLKKKSRLMTQAEDKNNQKESEVQYTLMEYLIKNRPEFVFSAEYRRQMLLNSRILRERKRDTLKFDFLENNLGKSNEKNYKLFTEKEMRDITRKNYQKLPEVQGKLINQRESKLRQADRLISNMLAKKVQKSVLRGKGSFPIDKPLTNL